mgnify:CR=1 FL=1|jgi:hypothetical protein
MTPVRLFSRPPPRAYPVHLSTGGKDVGAIGALAPGLASDVDAAGGGSNMRSSRHEGQQRGTYSVCLAYVPEEAEEVMGTRAMHLSEEL